MHVKIWTVICIIVLCTILTLGLWPFHSPRNNVNWLPDRTGLLLGKPATVFGSNAVSERNSAKELGASLEVWLQPESMWFSGTFLSLYCPKTLRAVSLRQSENDLEVQVENHDQPRSRSRTLQLTEVFRRKTPVFITLSSDGDAVHLYINGVLARTAPGSWLSASDLAGRVIVGDSPWHTRTWRGQFFGLAFYEQALTADRVINHYQSWVKTGRPGTTDDRNIALYLFRERRGNVVHSETGSGSLYFPDKYMVLDKVHMEPVWDEYEMSRNYWDAVLKNVVGFIPLGFCFYPYWTVAHRFSKGTLTTIVLGAAVSLTIEFLQSYLPTRESGVTDLITNTAGTAIGILLYRMILTFIQRYEALAGLVPENVFPRQRHSPRSRSLP